MKKTFPFLLPVIFCLFLSCTKDHDNKELEERVNQHIVVNNDLKTRLEGLMKSGGVHSSVSYLKD